MASEYSIAQTIRQDKGVTVSVKTFGVEVERLYQVSRLVVFSPSVTWYWNNDGTGFQTLNNHVAITTRLRKYYDDWITGPYLLGFGGIGGFDQVINDDSGDYQVLLGGGFGYDFDKDELKRIQIEAQGGITLTGRYYVGIGVNLAIW